MMKIAEKLMPYMREHHEQSFSSSQLRRWGRKAGFTIQSQSYVRFVPYFCWTPLAKLAHRLEPIFERLPLFRACFAGTIVLHLSQTKMDS